MMFASSGDEIKIWNARSFSEEDQFSPFATVSDLCWSHDGQVLAACCSSSDSIQLTFTKLARSVPADSFSVGAGCCCLEFSSLSKYILCGCNNGVAHIWDRKSHKIKKSFSFFDCPITRARWNWNDTYIALGSQHGQIVLCNIVTGVASNPLATRSSQAVCQLMYNPFQKASLVSVLEDGVVNIWDTNSHRLVHGFTSSHQAPARDLAFSPINDHLMVSVGLDKRCVLYDIQNKKPLNTIMGEHPLTSVDMMDDGSTLVVGSSRGKIFVYDMRKDSSPVLSLAAHGSSVKCLSFIKKTDGKENSFAAQNIKRQLPVAPSPVTLIEDSVNKDKLSEDVPFSVSPLRNQSATSDVDVTDMLANNSFVNRMLKSLENSPESSKLRLSGVPFCVSPLRNHSATSDVNVSDLLANNSLVNRILKSNENSAVENSVSQNFSETAISPDRTEAQPVSSPKSLSISPRLSARGLGASPSFQQLNHSSDPSGLTAAHYQSPTSHAAAALRHTRSGQESLLNQNNSAYPSLDAGRHVDGEASVGAADIQTSFEERRSKMHTAPSPMLAKIVNGHQGYSSMPHTPQQATSSPAPVTSLSSLRHLVKDLLKEQFQEHQEQLKAEIRTMMGNQPAAASSNTCPGSNSSSAQGLSATRRDPETFQADYIRNMIREELDDLKDHLHQEYWDLKMEVLRQSFIIEQKLEAGFTECCWINPLLLDEIDRLKEENARLKKVF